MSGRTDLTKRVGISVFLAAMLCGIASGGTIYGVAAVPPTHATNPDPADGAEDVSVDTNLTWVRGEGAKWDQVYFGTDPCDANLTLVATIPDSLPAEYDPGDPDPGTEPNLIASTTYYWYITEVNGPNEYPGPVWSFTTLGGEAQCDYPEDGAVIPGHPYIPNPDYTYTELIFIPGPTAVKYTGYFSKVRDEVANRAEDAKLILPPYCGFFCGDEYMYYVGRPEYYPYESLIRGQVYYWTVDETDAFGNLFPGEIWSFSVQPYEAFVPSPPNEAVFISTDVELSWLAGYGAQLHDVFFGTDKADVNNAYFTYPVHNSSPEYQGTTDAGVLYWQMNGLDPNTRYYWRIDGVQGRIPPQIGLIYKGDVWSFTTVGGEAQCEYPEDGAVIAGDPYIPNPDYTYTEMIFIMGPTAVKHTGYLSTNRDDVVSRVEDANLGPPPLAGMGFGEIYERLYYAGRPEYPPHESLIRGTVYYWTVDETDALGNVYSGDVWEFTVQEYKYKASLPNPPNEATDVETDVLLSWVPGIGAECHDVFFGTNWEDVNNAYFDFMSPPAELLGTISEPYIFVTGLAFNTKYYWRVDEIQGRMPPSPPMVYRGDVWCFTTVPHRIFVDVDATGANDGTNWADAYNYLQDALADAGSALKPIEIWVAEGIYTPDSDSADPNGSGDRMATFQLISGVTIKGGYAGFGESNPNARDIELYQTILSGDLSGNDVDVNDAADLLDEPTRAENSYHVVTGIYCNQTAIIDGFTITGGNSNWDYPDNCGGGMLNDNGSPTVTNCTFTGNTANYSGGGIDNNDGSPRLTNCTFSGNSAEVGGGMYNSRIHFNPKLTNCTFSGNYAGSAGGGMYNNSSSPTLNNCTFSENSSAGYGGGMSDSGAGSELTNCTFIRNSAIYGGAIDDYKGGTSLANCMFISNSADYGGVIFTGDISFVTLTNCTFAANSATLGNAVACDGYGSWGPVVSDLQFTNCILWNGGNETWINDNSVITIRYSDVQGGWSGPGGNNIDADPCFVEPGYWDPNGTPQDANDDFWVDGVYHLLPDSPCIDAGYNNAPNLPATDFDGHPRIIDGDCNETNVVDMGAYEFNYAYIGDFDYDCSVDFVDFSIFGLAWMTKPGDAQWNRFCDISKPSDNYIDWLDAAIVCDNWLAGIP